MAHPRVLVLYATNYGHTRKVADALAEPLRSAGLEVDVVDAKAAALPNPERYEGVLVTAAVRAGQFRAEVRRWVKTHAAALNRRPTAFVMVCLAVLEHTPKADATIAATLQRFFRQTGWQPRATLVAAGSLLYTRYNWFIRFIMRRIVSAAHGDTDTSRDYEYTNWREVAAFAASFAGRISPAASRAAPARRAALVAAG